MSTDTYLSLRDGNLITEYCPYDLLVARWCGGAALVSVIIVQVEWQEGHKRHRTHIHGVTRVSHCLEISKQMTETWIVIAVNLKYKCTQC